MFSPLKSGGWAYGEILTSAQMNQANEDLPFALDGRSGGGYTPSGNLTVQSPTTKKVVLNGCTFLSTADGGGVLQCASSMSVVGQVGCGSINAAGSSIFADNLDVEGNLTVVGSVTADSIAGTPRLTGVMIQFGTGRVFPKVLVSTSDADLTYGPADYEVITIRSGFLTADRAID